VKRWDQRVLEAEKRKAFTPEDKNLCILWTNCAISEVDQRIPRKPDTGAPLDFYLKTFGADFMSQVQGDKVAMVKVTLANIKKREQQLLDLILAV
jgi:hypothetical protein